MARIDRLSEGVCYSAGQLNRLRQSGGGVLCQ